MRLVASARFVAVDYEPDGVGLGLGKEERKKVGVGLAAVIL